jgi:signal transduction histidine kinase
MSEELIKLLGDLAVALSPVLVALVGLLAAFFAKLIKGKVKQQLLAMAMGKLNEMVWTVVKDLEQTLASEFKKAAADGKLTDAENLKELALKKLKSYLSFDELGKLLGLSSNAAESFVSSKVEAAVSDLKDSKAVFSEPASD